MIAIYVVIGFLVVLALCSFVGACIRIGMDSRDGE